MSGGDVRGEFLYNLPSNVSWKFCRVMDGLSDQDWTRFASEVLGDQTDLRLVERKERRTAAVMNQWENRNGRVGELLDLLEYLQLLRPRDIILDWTASVRSPPPPPPVSVPQFFPPPPVSLSAPLTLTACSLSTTDKGGGRTLPGPAPPPSILKSVPHECAQTSIRVACGNQSGGVMCWSYEEVHAGTEGFAPSLQVGEGGFGVVYRALLRNTDCAVKRLKQDVGCLMDWKVLKETFETEVVKLSKFRHPNIVDLLGFCEGQGSVCLIYSYMENRSLEDQLHCVSGALSWCQRVSVVKDASAALQFLHSPPEGHTPVIHGDVKSSNILLDRHLVAKLGDFGLARFVSSGSPALSPSKTASIGKTAKVRGTLAYLPDEYVRNGELGTVTDVYSFGVVLLEVLTGRRALERDRKSGDVYLKDVVDKVQDSPTGSCAAAWSKQLDRRLISAGATEPSGSMETVSLACRCLDKKRKKRPLMIEVFDKLQDIYNITRISSSSPLIQPSSHRPPSSQSLSRATQSLDSNVEALSHQFSKLDPLEYSYQPPSSSALCPPPSSHPLKFSSSIPALTSTSLPAPSASSTSFDGPCETDESRGLSQYDIHSQISGSSRNHIRSHGTGSRSLPTRDQHHRPAWPPESQVSQPSLPTEDLYDHPLPSNCVSQEGGELGPDSRGVTTAVPQCPSPGEPLKSLPSAVMNPSEQQLLESRAQLEGGRIRTREPLLLDLNTERSSAVFRGPEESDELDYLPPAKSLTDC
ncbi:interleukin-1 receptor-associated kinase 1 [Aulostomus maculatus]